MFTFQKHYFVLTILFLIIEVLIALFVHDSFIRPYVGDFLVVMLIYCFIKSFFRITLLKAALGVLLFSYLVEFMQYLKFVKYLGLQKSNMANTILGNSFAWVDMLAYTLGVLVIVLIEKSRSPNKSLREEKPLTFP